MPGARGWVGLVLPPREGEFLGEQKFAAVILPLATGKADQPYFYYRVPPALAPEIQIGSWVEVPLRSRRVRGWVVELVPACPVADPKDILRVLSPFPAFNQELLALSKWVAQTHLCSLGAVLKALGPVWLARPTEERRRRVVRLAVPAAVAQEAREALAKRAPKQAGVLASLLAEGAKAGLDLETLGANREVIRALEARGLVRLEDAGAEAAETGATAPGQEPFALNAGQRAALAEIEAALRQGGFKAFLLHGVTGSGKTEVYLRAIATALSLGKQAIFLVPEIALTPQMVSYLRERFGSSVVVLHSRLSQKERATAWQRLAQGQASVAVGARSGVFAPVPRLGLIVVDEEQESSYKQEVTPRYHTRDVALKRAQLASAVVLLGTATPSLETYYWAQQGYFRLLRLDERVDGKALPRVQIVDMRQELRSGNAGIFSRYLEERLSSALARGEQALLFLNRRGFHAFLVCRNCGEALRCRACDITLTYHRRAPVLRCHYCGYSLAVLPPCPICGDRAWLGLGSGTQRIEEEISRRWPQVRVLRLDRDVLSYRGAHVEIYEAFRRGEADILVGTQMVAKGFNFPRLTLVGVINADITLNLPDFRARERTFQLLTQVAGRAGRGERPGEVVVQTFFPEDYSIQAASHHDYQAFYQKEIKQRQRLGYPPFASLVLLMISAPREDEARAAAEELGRLLTKGVQPGTAVLGPAPAPLAKLQGRYRYQLILKGRPLRLLREMARQALAAWQPKGQVRVAIDINPLLLL